MKITGQQLIGLTILPLSLTGFICNFIILHVTYRIRSLSPSFALLTGCLALFDTIFSIIYFGYVGIMIVFDIKLLKYYSYQCGFLLMICYDASMELHLVISLNRFFAVFTPVLYRRMFGSVRVERSQAEIKVPWASLKATKLYAFLCFAFSFANLFVYSKIFGCQTYYDDSIWMFYFNVEDQFCVEYSWIADYSKNLGGATLNAFIDIVTILKVQATRKQIQKSSQKSAAIRKREIDFIKQTCFQGIVSLFALAVYFNVPYFITNMYIAFMMTTFLWGCLSTSNGIAVLIYNSEIRGNLRKLKHRKTSFVSVVEKSQRT